jgi:hypothetical protein
MSSSIFITKLGLIKINSMYALRFSGYLHSSNSTSVQKPVIMSSFDVIHGHTSAH